MSLIKSIAELSSEQIRDTWYNASQIYVDLHDFYKSSLVSILDDSGFALDDKHLSPHSFLERCELSITCVPMESLLDRETWDGICSTLYLGIWIDTDKGNQMSFFAWFEFAEDFHQNYFHNSAKATKLRKVLESKGWTFEFADDKWILSILEPANKIDLTVPTWKRELKKFYERSLNDISETVIKTKEWFE